MISSQQNSLVGIFWMFVTGLCFVSVMAVVKVMGPRVPPAEAAFLRYVIGLVFLIPMIPVLRTSRITRQQWALFGWRGVCHSLGVMLWFYAMTSIPIAEVTAMNYLAPVYVTIGAALFLGERLAVRRLAAVGVALVGVAVILRPGFREVAPGHVAMLFCAVSFAASYLLGKIMADQAKPTVVVAMLSIFVTIGLAPFALANWVTPSWGDLGLLFVVACFATAGHYTMTMAFAAAPVTVTQPVTFLQLIWAVALGALVFAEPVDVWVILGGLLILCAITYMTWREAMLKRKTITPSAPATKL